MAGLGEALLAITRSGAGGKLDVTLVWDESGLVLVPWLVSVATVAVFVMVVLSAGALSLTTSWKRADGPCDGVGDRRANRKIDGVGDVGVARGGVACRAARGRRRVADIGQNCRERIGHRRARHIAGGSGISRRVADDDRVRHGAAG